MAMDIIEIKKQIKQWEHSFIEQYGKPPSKNDVKRNTKIDKFYRIYKRLRSKSSTKTALIDTINDFSDEDSEYDFSLRDTVTRNSQLGPTPQGGGKVLSIFDVKPFPESSPLTRKHPQPVINHEQFKTPQKIKVDFSTNTTQNISLMQKLANAAKSPYTTPCATPTKTDVKSYETPEYLNKNIQKFDFTKPNNVSPFNSQSLLNCTPTNKTTFNFQVSPSPLFQRSNKRLLDVFQAHKNINITQEETQAYEVNDIDDIDDDYENDPSRLPVKIRKAKTQKRTTRRWKIKPVAQNNVDSMANQDIKQMVKDIKQKEEANLENILNSQSEDEIEREHQKENMPQVNRKVKMIAPVSHNYKLMKIHYKRNKKWGKRR